MDTPPVCAVAVRGIITGAERHGMRWGRVKCGVAQAIGERYCVSRAVAVEAVTALVPERARLYRDPDHPVPGDPFVNQGFALPEALPYGNRPQASRHFSLTPSLWGWDNCL